MSFIGMLFTNCNCPFCNSCSCWLESLYYEIKVKYICCICKYLVYSYNVMQKVSQNLEINLKNY